MTKIKTTKTCKHKRIHTEFVKGVIRNCGDRVRYLEPEKVNYINVYCIDCRDKIESIRLKNDHTL